MSLYALSDLHGCWTALETMLERSPIQSDDTIIGLGDYVDRGPDSRRVLEWVMERTALGTCLPLRGNHEVMLVDAVRGGSILKPWLQFGGQEALDSYTSGRKGRVDDIPAEHLAFLEERLLPGYETDTHLFVHASLEPHLPLSQQPDEALYWKRFETLLPHQSGKIVICGHTAQKSGSPANRGYGICLDTCAYGGGWLTSMNVETGEYFQSNQRGEFRQGTIFVESFGKGGLR